MYISCSFGPPLSLNPRSAHAYDEVNTLRIIDQAKMRRNTCSWCLASLQTTVAAQRDATVRTCVNHVFAAIHAERNPAKKPESET